MVDALGLLATRLTVGLSFASHGTQKAFGWFEGPGPEKAAGFLETLGFKPGTQFATAASYSEIAAGTLIALGFGGPVGPALLISTMIVAQTSAHVKNGFFAQKGGVELGVVYASAALGLAASGYGPLSLDHALGLQKPLRHPVLTALALAGAVAGAYYILEQRDFTPPDGTLATPTFSAEQRNGEVPGTSAAPAAS